MAFIAPPLRFDGVEQPQGLGLDVVRGRLHREGTAHRIDHVRHSAFVGDHLLGAQGEGGRGLRGQGERFVHGVGVEALATAQNRGQGLHGHPHDVVLGLLRGQGDAARLHMEPQMLGLGIGDPEALLHQRGPEAPGRPELGHLLDEVRMAGEEERQTLAEHVRVEPFSLGGADVLEGVGEGEGELLRRGRSGLANVIARDGDGVPLGDTLVAVGEEIGDEAERGLGRVDIGAAGHVLLEDVVLHRARQRFFRDAAPPRHRDVQPEQDRRRRIDGHRRGDLIEGNGVEERLHVLERIDGNPDPAHFAHGVRVVGVVADLRGQVEGYGKPHGALREQISVALVRLASPCRNPRTGAWSRNGNGSRRDGHRG
jgi:hypothetical protein